MLSFFYRKILNLTVRRSLIRRRELTLSIGKPGPKTEQLQLVHLQLNNSRLDWDINRYSLKVGRSDWDIDTSLPPGRIGTSTRAIAKTLPGQIGTSTRATITNTPMPPEATTAWSDWDIDTSSPFAAITSSQAQRPAAQEAARSLQPRHRGATGTPAWLLPAKQPWHRCQLPKQTAAGHAATAFPMHPRSWLEWEDTVTIPPRR